MEFDTFPSSESDSSSTSKEKKKKKSLSSAAVLAELATDKTLKKQDKQNTADSIWQKIRGDIDQNGKPELPLFGIPKPTELKSGDVTNRAPEVAGVDGESPQESAQQPDGQAQESGEHVNDEQELKRAARNFTEIRLQDADGELHELPLDARDTPQAAEAAADVALLRAMQERLSMTTTDRAAEAIDAAEADVTERINASIEPVQENTENEVDDQLAASEPEQPPLSHAEEAEHYASFAAASIAERQSAAPPVSAREISPSSMVSSDEAYHNERSAAAQGLLVGGIAGYFIGRRRGKKIGRKEAEKSAAPVRKGLEQQVQTLQQSITSKESQIKAMARERVGRLAKSQERSQMIENILRPAEQIADSRSQASAETGNKPSSTISRGENEPTAKNTRRQELASASSDLGRLLVEAPLVALASGMGRSERALVVPFNKKVEQFSNEELMQTAEKIKVQNVSLKEMMQLGSIDAEALKRVVAEFLEGGNVEAAVTREVDERERRFERDPQMRRQSANTAGGSIGSASGGTGVTGDAVLADSQSASEVSSPTEYSGKRPVPDDETLRALKEKQIIAVGSTTVVVMIIVMALILLLR